MATTTNYSFDDDDCEGHGALYRGLHDFIRQFILVAFNPNQGA
jgi:hypothetical protein